MKRILITLLTIAIVSVSVAAQDSDYKKRLRTNFTKADSVFNQTHQKQIIELEVKVNLQLGEIQHCLNKSNIDCKIKQIIYRKENLNVIGWQPLPPQPNKSK